MAKKRRPVKRKKPTRKRRPSKAEQTRRNRISRALRSYWRGIKSVRAERLMQAFEPTPLAAPGPSLIDYIRDRIAETGREVEGEVWEAEEGTENAAFLLRTQQPDLHEMFPHNENVTATFHLVKFENVRKLRAVDEFDARVAFNTGADEAEFWRNYHSAARSTLAGAGSDLYAITVTRIA